MAQSILEIPTELLLHVFGFLSIKSVLKFSQCSRHARSMATSGLHTLKLDFCSPPYLIDDFCPTRGTFSARSSTGDSAHFLRKLASSYEFTKGTLGSKIIRPSNEDKCLYKINVRVAEAHTYDFETLINFNSALLFSILTRYSSALQTLDISIWTLTVPVARAISKLAVLSSLSITLEELASHRTSVETQNKAWQVIAGLNAWTGRLRALKVQNAGLYPSQLIVILENNPSCRDLQMINCNALGRALWDFLGGNWEGQTSLRALTISNCGGSVDVKALMTIGKLKGLQVRPVHILVLTLSENQLTACHSSSISTGVLVSTVKPSAS
jgi:hypothetical protein